MRTTTVRLDIKGYHHDYPVHVERGLTSDLGDILDMSKAYVIITDDGVPDVHVNRVANQLRIKTRITVPKGEHSKSFETYRDTVLKLQKANVDRSDSIIAVGGGMVSDLAGFVAATYKRGLPFIIIPTTLLSMVDASVGGKVAINTPFAKNSVGTFHTPESVLIDPGTLQTLSRRQFNNGMAEVIKTALIKDRALFDHLRSETAALDLDYVIKASVDVKARIVEEDPLDKGERGLLNYGHTIGHAIEGESGYRFLHGECVAMGMRMMARSRPFEKDLLEVLKRYRLDNRPEYDIDTLMERIREDKKVVGDHINIADVKKVGNGFIRRTDFNEIKEILKGGILS